MKHHVVCMIRMARRNDIKIDTIVICLRYVRGVGPQTSNN